MKLSFSKDSVKPEALGLPEIKVRSLGKTIYKPRFVLGQKDKLIVELGHYWGFGSYYVETLMGIRDRGLSLYGGDKSSESSIGEQEILHLLAYLVRYEDRIVKKLKSHSEVA